MPPLLNVTVPVVVSVPALVILPVALTVISVAAAPLATVKVCPAFIMRVPPIVKSSACAGTVMVTLSPALTNIPAEFASVGMDKAATGAGEINAGSVDTSQVDVAFQLPDPVLL